MLLKTLAFLVATAAAADPAAGVSASPPAEQKGVGGVMAPAVLPAGDLAVWGVMGAPDVGAGYRQGFQPLELEARVLFNYLELSAVAEAGVKLPVMRTPRFTLAAGGALGFKGNTGARYYDAANFAFFALRLRPSLQLSAALSEMVQAVALVELPINIPFTSTGVQLTPTAGGGAEFYLGSRLSVLATAHLGFDLTKEPLGVAQVRPAWAIRLGVGYRVF